MSLYDIHKNNYRKGLVQFVGNFMSITDTAILDGQQRLTSLYLSLFGESYIRQKYARKSKGGSTVTKLLIELNKNKLNIDDEDEYRIIIMDNAANLTVEKGCKDQRETIEKMSKYNITLRKQLNYIVVFIQHQAQSQEGIENLKLDRVHPTTDGLGDCKTTSRDANCVIGLYSPYKFKKKEHNNYDISKLLGYCRFLEILEDRDYGANGHECPLFFDGATSTFKELPKSTETEKLNKYYQLIQRWETEDPTTEFESPQS